MARSHMHPNLLHHHRTEGRTVGQRVADAVAANMGSWRFIIIQSTILFFWIVVNATELLFHPWDPYPFILLNLMLSFQAAYAAPFIMMSQNRQSEVDRQHAENSYAQVQEIDALTKEIDQLTKEVHDVTLGQRDLVNDVHAIAAHLRIALHQEPPSPAE